MAALTKFDRQPSESGSWTESARSPDWTHATRWKGPWTSLTGLRPNLAPYFPFERNHSRVVQDDEFHHRWPVGPLP